MTRATRFLLCACLVGLLASICRQHAEAADVELLRKQQGLFREIDDAALKNDFPKQYSLLMEMRDLTLYRENELKVVGLDEIDFIAADLELGTDFSVEQMELALEASDKTYQGGRAFNWKSYGAAVELYRDNLKICQDLYGPESYKALHAQVILANAIRMTGDNLKAGVAAASEAAQSMERAGQTDFRIYCESQLSLTRLYALLEDHPQAVVAGERTFALMDKFGIQRSSTYPDVAGLLANALNQLQRHDEALDYAIKGRIAAPAEQGEQADFYYRLLVESARANLGLQRQDDALRDFALLVYKSEENKNCSQERRLEFLQEYAAALKQAGDEDRLEIASRKIESLQRKIKGEVEFTGEKSRYSN